MSLSDASSRRIRSINQHLAASSAAASSPAAAGASHRQTKYRPAPQLTTPVPLPMPPPTSSIDQAKADLSEYGLCVLTDALSPELLSKLRGKLDRQGAAEAKAFDNLLPGKNIVSALVNKGDEFLELLDHPVVEDLCGYVFGKHYLLSSLTGSYFNGPENSPQVLHRDQGYVPATADFPAAMVMFWCLDDFTTENGGTHVIPGSHRWPAEHLVKPPSRDLVVPINAPAGSVFAWDGRLWHGTGPNLAGEPRRSIGTFWCLPWMRQQENWGLTTLQETIDKVNDKVKARLGLMSYGTLGTVSGGAPPLESSGGKPLKLGNGMVEVPDAVVGEDAVLHPMRRVSSKEVGRAARGD